MINGTLPDFAKATNAGSTGPVLASEPLATMISTIVAALTHASEVALIFKLSCVPSTGIANSHPPDTR